MTIEMMTAKQVLRECQVFSTLSETELEKIASSASEKQYEAGTTIFQEGDRAEEFLVLQEGQVALQMTLPRALGQTGRRVTVDLVSTKEIVGWSAIVEPYIYTLTAICLRKVKALSIGGDKLRWIVRDNHKIGYEILNELVKVVALRLDDTRRVLVSERSFPLSVQTKEA